MLKKILSCILVTTMVAGMMIPVASANVASGSDVTALSKDGIAFRMGLIGDVHISDTGAFTNYMEQAVETLNKVGGIDVFGFTGDVISYDAAVTEAPYDYLNDILSEGNISNTIEGATPYIYAMGNHEYIHGDANMETCTQAMEMFEMKMGHPVDYHQEYNGYHVIAGGAHSYQFQWSNGELNANEEWMMSEIEAIEAEEDYTPDEPIFLIMHQPLANSVLRGLTTIGNKYSEEFQEFLSQRPNIVQISGHYHMAAQYPQTICQDLGFTAFQAPETSSVGVQNKHQTSFIDVTVDNKVKIYKIDITTGKYIGEPWIINIPEGVAGFNYTDEIRNNNTQTPVFAENDKITFSDIYYYSATVDFPTGMIEAKNEQQDNMVRSHRLTVTNKDTGEIINQISYDADFWVVPQPQTLSRTITGLESGTQYTISIEPRSMFGFYGEPITADFTTKGNPYEVISGEKIDNEFDSALIGEITDEDGNTSYDALTETDIILSQGDYFTYKINVGEGEKIKEAGLYKLIYNYGSKEEASVATYVKWQGNDNYVTAEKSVYLPASGDYASYVAQAGEALIQLTGVSRGEVQFNVTSDSKRKYAYTRIDLENEYHLKKLTWTKTNYGKIPALNIYGANKEDGTDMVLIAKTESIADTSVKVINYELDWANKYRFVFIKPTQNGNMAPLTLSVYAFAEPELTTAEDGLTTTVTVPSSYYAIGDTVIAASYNGGKLSDVELKNPKNGEYSAEAILTKETAEDTVKFMVWKDLKNLVPRMEEVSFE